MAYRNKFKDIGIDYLYHITDRDNISSIIRNGGVSSWKRAIISEMYISRPGGDAISHNLDSRNNIRRDNYVHLYLKQPNEEIVKLYKETGRFGELYILRISTDILNNECVFWMGDPYDPNTEHIDNIDVFVDKVRSNPELLNVCELDVWDFIPRRKIVNLPESHTSKISEENPTAIIFVINQSRSMKKSVICNNVVYDYMSDLVAEIVNEQIEHLLKKCVTEDAMLDHLFDIAIVGYGDDAYSGWSSEDMQGFQSPYELYHHMKKTNNKYCWVDTVNSARTDHCEKGLEYAYNLLENWMKKREGKYYYPPTVIHINDGVITREYQTEFLLMAEKIKSLKSYEGNVVLWNIGLTNNKMSEKILPSGEEISSFINLPGAMVMYEASSYLREELNESARDLITGNHNLARRTMGININRDNLINILRLCILPQS
jgi:hypothetical protein